MDGPDGGMGGRDGNDMAMEKVKATFELNNDVRMVNLNLSIDTPKNYLLYRNDLLVAISTTEYTSVTMTKAPVDVLLMYGRSL